MNLYLITSGPHKAVVRASSAEEGSTLATLSWASDDGLTGLSVEVLGWSHGVTEPRVILSTGAARTPDAADLALAMLWDSGPPGEDA